MEVLFRGWDNQCSSLGNRAELGWLVGTALLGLGLGMGNRGREALAQASFWVVGLTLVTAGLPGCKKDKKPSQANTAPAITSVAATTGSSAPVLRSVPEPLPVTTPARCESDADWKALELKHLQDGRVDLALDALPKPTFKWAPCDGDKPQCERLVLAGNQSLLAIGSNGKTLKLAVAETCGNNTAVTVATPDTPASVMLRGVDMSFDSAVIGGERLLLGGYARHASEHAKEGYVPREYLLSVRETTTLSVEPARNKQNAVPLMAANQLVRVKSGDNACTTVFWKLGVDQCDFAGPPGDNVALFGSHLIYRGDANGVAGTKGMAWSAAAGHRELLPKLDWVVSDGVNLAWSTGSELFSAQPRWDLPELKGKALPGAPGPRPAALGCGRTLTPSADGWTLRILATGTQWDLKADRFPTPVSSVVMNCDWLVSNTGYRTSLANLGKPTPAGESPATESATTESTRSATTVVSAPPTSAPAVAQPPAAPAPSAERSSKSQ